MKSIINKKIYNTDTAKEMASTCWGYNLDDSYHISETLYRKRTGEFFLHGYGGDKTEYRMYRSGYWWDGEKIMPMTTEEAKAWVKSNFIIDIYIKIFGKEE